MSRKRVEQLGGGISVITEGACTFGADAFILARFALPKDGERAADLGTGTGIIPLLWARDSDCDDIVGLEIQPRVAGNARLSVLNSGLCDRIKIITGDLKNAEAIFAPCSFDSVAMNPPFFRTNACVGSPDPSRRTARSDENASLSEVCTAAAYMLKIGGRLALCTRPESGAELEAAMSANGFSMTKRRFVSHDEAHGPFLLLTEAVKGESGNVCELIAPFFINSGGKPTPEYSSLYGGMYL